MPQPPDGSYLMSTFLWILCAALYLGALISPTQRAARTA